MDRETAKTQKADYDQAVQDTAEDVVEELLERYDDQRFNWKNLFVTVVSEHVREHPYCTNPELALLTLQYSDHPSAGIANGTGPLDAKDLKNGATTNFPFCGFAACAFETDVIQAALELFEEHEGVTLNEPEFDTGVDPDTIEE